MGNYVGNVNCYYVCRQVGNALGGYLVGKYQCWVVLYL